MINPVNKKLRLSPNAVRRPKHLSSNESTGSIKKPFQPMQGTSSTDGDEINSMAPPATKTTEKLDTHGDTIVNKTPSTLRDSVKNKNMNSSSSHRTRLKPRETSKTKPIRRPLKRGQSTLKNGNMLKKSSAILIGAARKKISSPAAQNSTTTTNETRGSEEDEENQSTKRDDAIPNASEEPAGETSIAKASTSNAATQLAVVTDDYHPYQHLGQLDPAWKVPALKENEKTMKDFCSKFEIPKEDKVSDEADGRGVEENIPVTPVSKNVGVEKEKENIHGEEGNDANASGPLVEIINGEIVIKESSIIIGGHQTTEDVDKELAADGAVVEEDAYGITATYTSFTNKLKTQHWKLDETRMFYTALRQCGPDFSTMEQMYEGFDKPKTRKQLKSKYKRECKKNPRLIDMAMNPSAQIPLDHSLFSNLDIEKTAKKDPTESSTFEKEAALIKSISTELLSVKSNTNEHVPKVIHDVDQPKLTIDTPQSIGSKQEPSEPVKVLDKEFRDGPTKITGIQPAEPVVKNSEDSVSDNVAKPIALFGVMKKSAQRPKFRAKARPKKSKMKRPVN